MILITGDGFIINIFEEKIFKKSILEYLIKINIQLFKRNLDLFIDKSG
jgi:hypothetical protein